jgi:hypothetical protein
MLFGIAIKACVILYNMINLVLRPKKVSSFLPPSHVVDGIGVLINIFKWKIYEPIIYQRTEHVCPFQQHVDMHIQNVRL